MAFGIATEYKRPGLRNGERARLAAHCESSLCEFAESIDERRENRVTGKEKERKGKKNWLVQQEQYRRMVANHRSNAELQLSRSEFSEEPAFGFLKTRV